MPQAHVQAGAAAFGHHQQQQASYRAPLVSMGDLVLFVDTSVSHLSQLYRTCTLLAAHGQQHAGTVTINWVADVRSRVCADSSSSSGSSHGSGGDGGGGGSGTADGRVRPAVLHLCTSLLAVAANADAGSQVAPFDCEFLVLVLEQLIRALMDLRALDTGPPHAARGLITNSLQAWWLQLQAKAGTCVGQAVLQLMGWLRAAIAS